MGENSNIGWTDHTFNGWIGCTKVSPACDFCYAESLAKRYGWAEWGVGKPRHRTSEANWKQPLAWNRKAEKHGVRYLVFANSLSDWADAEVPEAWRDDLMVLIEATPHLTWMLLTKRPKVARDYALKRGGLPANVWAGTTVENQKMADARVPLLLETPATKRFLSCEPLLGPVDLTDIPWSDAHVRFPASDDISDSFDALRHTSGGHIDWVIVGGESGRGARPMHPGWAKALRNQCQAAGVPYFFKQWGEWAPHSVKPGGDLGDDVRSGRVRVVHRGAETDVEVAEKTGGRSTLPGSRYMARVGVKPAGRFLDGTTWSEFPS